MNKTICKEKRLCTGCMACKNICPKKCIKIIVEKDGFSYPLIENHKCVNCGLCEATCPVNSGITGSKPLAGYVVRNRNNNVLLHSTSGGSFAAFAEYVFSVDGFIAGVVYDEDMRVVHFGVDNNNRDEIIRMRGSKYVQSDLKNIFCTIKDKLSNNKLVCFSGTPCQVAGLKAFLGKDYENLITIDLVCHGVGSPSFFEKYIDYVEKKHHSRVVDAKFRNKTYGYHSSTMKVELENGKKYYGSGRIDYMLKAFFKEAVSRLSCYECPFKGIKRYGDFTIFDCWHAKEIIGIKRDDDKGFTNMYVNTKKGLRILDELRQYLYLWEANIDQMREWDGLMVEHNPNKFVFRDELLEELNDGEFESVVSHYIHISKKDVFLEGLKKVLYKLKILNIVKRIK